MRAASVFMAILVAFSFAACTTSDDVMDSVSDFSTVKALYGLEEISVEVAGENNAPAVTLEEMKGVLETLHSANNIQKECVMAPLSRSGEETDFTVSMVGDYKTATRIASATGTFSLKVDLRFSLEDNKIYYWGTDYSYSSDLFKWSANGLSLASAKGANYTYEFNSDTYLYFKVSDEGNCLLRVPLVFSGSYNFETGRGVYSFRLLKYGK